MQSLAGRRMNSRKVRPSLGVKSAVLIGALLVLEGCAGAAPVAEATVPAATERYAVATIPVSPPSSMAVTPHLVDIDHERGAVALPWVPVSVDATGHDLVISVVIGGGCTKPLGVAVEQSADRVAIWSLGRTVGGSDTICSTQLGVGIYLIHLTAPLGDRELLHSRFASGWATPVPITPRSSSPAPSTSG